jgi:hypothetical protein
VPERCVFLRDEEQKEIRKCCRIQYIDRSMSDWNFQSKVIHAEHSAISNRFPISFTDFKLWFNEEDVLQINAGEV